MKPSSSPSEPPGAARAATDAGPRAAGAGPGPGGAEPPGGLFDGVLARGGVRSQVDDLGWLQAMLDAEAALARAQARVGLLTDADAARITAACRAENFDVAALGRDAATAGNPVVPLVRALAAALGADVPVHHGATSQDILDTAAMLVAYRALGPLLDDLAGAAAAAARLAETHRDTPMAGRTLLQHAVPITFGLTAAGWLTGVDTAARRLAELRATRLAAQLGGAAGTLAALGEHGVAVAAAFAAEVGLVEPAAPWHTERSRIAELAGALGSAAGAVAKPARDVTLLAQTEIAEIREGGGAGHGGSSTLPHKHNPIAAVSALAAAAQAPGLVATLLAAAPHEHQRAAGAWHAEWRPLRELLESVGSAAAWLRDCLEHLNVDAGRMRTNLDATGGLLLAEQISTALAPTLGRLAAHDLVRQAAAADRPFADALRDRRELADVDVDKLLDPAGYLGSAGAFVDRALAAYRRQR
jgi:3-carboxy-cis,cis-muconate cycloisomerase